MSYIGFDLSNHDQNTGVDQELVGNSQNKISIDSKLITRGPLKEKFYICQKRNESIFEFVLKFKNY